MKRMSLCFLMCCMLMAAAEDAPLKLNPQWSGYKAKAVSSPAVTQVTGPNGAPAVHIEATADSQFQGAIMSFNPPIDFSKYASLEFYIRHNVSSKNGGKITLALNAEGTHGYQYCNFVTPSSAWSKVSIPLDSTSFSAQRGNTVNLTGIKNIRIYPFRAMDKAGKFLEFSAITLLPKSTASGKIKVMSYKHLTRPDAGEKSNTLIDGELKANINYRAYSDDPNIVFDLGGRFTVDEIRVHANAAPSHNFSELAIFASYDNKQYSAVGAIKNTEEGTSPRACVYSIKGGEKPIVGRYIQIKGTRLRSDYQVNLSEIEFFGHTPTEAEIAKAAELNYDTGVPMPERTAKDYIELKQGPWQLWISRKNGVVNGLFHKGTLIAERLTPKYTLQSREKDTAIDGNQDVVSDVAIGKDAVTLTLTNPKLPGLSMKRTWAIDGNALVENVAVTNLSMTQRLFLRLATEVILERNFRKDGFYELPGTAIAAGMVRLPAEAVQMEQPITNIPTIAFENGKRNQVVWHTRFRFNGRFTYMDVGTEEDNLQCFNPNGWLITTATIVPLDRKEHSVENRLSLTEGGMLQAYDEYIALPEPAAFRGQVKRPAWLRDLRAIVSQGWDAAYKESGERHFTNYKETFSPRGYIIDPAMFDMDGIWGDLPTKGYVRGWFGNRNTAEELRDKIRARRAQVPNLKLGYYTWFWSAFPWSTPVKNHPEWFIKELRNGAPASWFPGVNVNYLRFMGIKESRDEMVSQISNFVNFYEQDCWYLDGGKSGTYAKDWPTMRIDDPLGQTDFYIAVRNAIQRGHPERVVFFNHSENPLGDIGYLESFGGTLTNEWRRGAILMWKFKMYAYKDPLHHSVYIYWLPGVDGAFHNYLAGIGVMPAYGSRSFSARDIPFISARYEIRQAQLTDAQVKPDWRLDANETLELMALRQCGNGWVFIHPHATESAREISVLTKPLGIDNPKKPVYAWLYKIRDARKYKGHFGDRQIAQAYKEKGWITERAVTSQFLGAFPWTERFSTRVTPVTGNAQVLMLSQIPAVILSIEDEPSHYLLAGQPGLSIIEKDDKYVVNSEYARVQIGILLENGQMPDTVTVNGKQAPAELRLDGKQRFAVVTLGKGESTIGITTKKGNPATATSMDASLTGRTLKVTVAPQNAIVSIYAEGALVRCGKGSFEFELPDAVRDATYEIRSGAQVRKLAIKKAGRPRKMLPILVTMPVKNTREPVHRVIRNIEVLSKATLTTKDTSHAHVDLENLQLTVGTNRVVENHFNQTGAALEIKAKRYLHLRIDNGYLYNNIYGYQPKRHAVRPANPQNYAGLILDFGIKGGYAIRSAAGLGVQNEKRSSRNPDGWGTAKKPHHVFSLDNLLVSETDKSRDLWLDLQTLGAPMGWDGFLWLGAYQENINPDREFTVTLLATRDTLPSGVKALEPLELGAAAGKVFELQKVTKLDWRKIKPLGTMVPLRSTMKPFRTTVRAAWDDKALYLRCEAEENPAHILVSDGGRIGKPWQGDGAEFFVQCTDRPALMLHGLTDVGDVPFVEIGPLDNSAGVQKETPVIMPFKSKFTKTPTGWAIDFEIKWSKIGGIPADDALVAFNVMRNRLEKGEFGHYTLAPNNKYFTQKQYQFKLKK